MSSKISTEPFFPKKSSHTSLSLAVAIIHRGLQEKVREGTAF